MQNYQIYEEIGKGKFSTVYKGRKKRTIDYFAVKSVEKSQRAKVLNEVQILHMLNHHNVLKFYNWYETNNHLWLIVEYCSGSDMLAILKSDKVLPEDTIQSFSADILEGLLYIHSRGILYCDLKPSNLLVDGSGIVKLSDFGLARHVEKLDYEKDGGKKVGSPPYMAPELFQEGGVHSFASDFWSLGCIVYEMLMGKTPFVAEDVDKLMQMILFDPVCLADQCSPPLRHLMDGLLQKDPLQRLTWQELAIHPYWDDHGPEVRALPLQPFWDQYVRAREAQAAQSRRTTQEKAAKVVPQPSTNPQTNSKQPVAGESHQQNGARRSSEVAGTVNRTSDSEVELKENTAGHDATAVEDDACARTKPSSPYLNGKAEPQETQGPSVPGTSAPRIRRDRPEDLAPLQKPAVVPAPYPTSPVLVPADQLLFHTSDSYVKPIMMNGRIEKVTEPKFTTSDLPFPAHSLATVNSMAQKELEAFLTQVYRAIGGPTKASEKYNCLMYFQTLCCDTQVANLFVNSSLMTLFIKMLHNPTHSAHLKAQLCMVMGLLVRHATFIHPDLRAAGFMEACTCILRETPARDKKLRRRCAACLGELLFYIATQSCEDKSNPQVNWDVTETVVQVFVDCMKGDDEVTRHYAAKTIENISAQPVSDCIIKFASTSVVHALISIYLTPTKNDHLRTTAITALARLCRIQPAGLAIVAEQLGPVGLLQLSSTNTGRANQAAVNLLNMLLAQCIAYYAPLDHMSHPSFLYSQLTLLKLRPSTREANKEEAQTSLFVRCHLGVQEVRKIEEDLRKDGGAFIASSLSTILEQGNNALRAKCLLTIFLLAFCGLRYLHLCCESKLCQIIERLSKEKDPYLYSCLQSLLKVIGVVATSSLSTLALDLECVNATTLPSQTVENLAIGVHVLTTPSIRAIVTSNAIIEWLARCLATVETLPTALQSDIKRNLFAVVEAFSLDATVLQTFSNTVVNSLLPALVGLLNSPIGDTRFLCLKMFIDILCNFTSGQDASQTDCAEEVSKALHALLNNRLVPLFDKLLEDEDPIPLYGLKLMNTLAMDNPALIEQLYKRNLMSRTFEFFELENRNNNVHNVKLVLKFVESPAIPKKLIYELGIAKKLSSVLQYATEKNVESFFEPCLDIAHSLLYCTAQAAKENAASEEYRMHHKQNSLIAKNIHLFVLLANSRDVCVSEVAAHSALLCAQLYSACHEAFLSPQNLAHLRVALAKDGDGAAVAKVLLKCLLVVLSSSSSGQDRTHLELACKDQGLRSDLLQLAHSSDADLRVLAGQINALLGIPH